MKELKIDLKHGAVVSESKRKKKGSARSQMLRMVMPMLSGEDGERLQNAVKNNDSAAMRTAMNSVVNKLAKKLDDQK